MPVHVENLTKKPLWLCLNSGTTLHIAPNTISAEVREVEVVNNPKVQKLLGVQAIALSEVEQEKKKSSASKKKKIKTSKRRR